jgi:hypothetical protein
MRKECACLLAQALIFTDVRLFMRSLIVYESESFVLLNSYTTALTSTSGSRRFMQPHNMPAHVHLSSALLDLASVSQPTDYRIALSSRVYCIQRRGYANDSIFNVRECRCMGQVCM